MKITLPYFKWSRERFCCIAIKILLHRDEKIATTRCRKFILRIELLQNGELWGVTHRFPKRNSSFSSSELNPFVFSCFQ